MRFKEFLFNETYADLLKIANKLHAMTANQIEDMMQRGESGWEGYLDRFKIRSEFTKAFSWSVPCKEAVDAIQKYARPPIYDLMAGTGYWAKILNSVGVKTYASDINLPGHNDYKHGKSHVKIRRKNALKVAMDMERARKSQGWKGDILLSWPPYESPVAHDVLDTLPIGTRVFYIGENFGGCTGDIAMHKNFCKNFKVLEIVSLPQFEGLHDFLTIYEKISNKPISSQYRGKTMIFDDDD